MKKYFSNLSSEVERMSRGSMDESCREGAQVYFPQYMSRLKVARRREKWKILKKLKEFKEIKNLIIELRIKS